MSRKKFPKLNKCEFLFPYDDLKRDDETGKAGGVGQANIKEGKGMVRETHQLQQNLFGRPARLAYLLPGALAVVFEVRILACRPVLTES